MSRFFYLHVLDVDGAGLAHGADDTDRDAILAEPGVVHDWSPLDLVLQSGRLADYLANDVGVRLCSSKLREIIDRHRSIRDQVQWLDANVVDADGPHPYFVLHLVSHPDVLDPERTITARGDFVVKAVLDGSRVGDHAVFSFAGATTRLIVAGNIRDAIIAAGCTGVDFGEVPLA